jgi:adenylate kinase
LRTDNTALFDRLTKRGYSTLKVGENVEAEIMQVVLEEALESYAEGAVHELASNSVEDMEANAARVNAWLATWLADHGVGGSGAAGFAGAQ